MKTKMAIVTGFSEKCYSMYKQMLASWYKNVINQNDYQIDLYPYMCNYVVRDLKLHYSQIDKSIKTDETWYAYVDFKKIPNFDKDLYFWNGNIFPQTCTSTEFIKSDLPDMSVYQSFCDKFLDKYEYVIFTHSDIKFKEKNNILHDIVSILNDDTDYSIIAYPTINADVHISFRFVTIINIVNTKKFIEQKLSFVNDMLLIDPNKYYVHGNGGNALFSSFYSKKNNPTNKYKPHVPYRWVDHLTHTEFRFVIEDAAKKLIPSNNEFDNKMIDLSIQDAKIAYDRIKKSKEYYKEFCKEYKFAKL